MTIDRADVLVLGAGIAGCALAHHLAARRVGRVVVVDPRTTAAGATGRAAGIVTEQLWNRFDVEVTRDSKAEYASLAARHDPSAYSVNGFARWTREEAAVEPVHQAVRRLRQWGVRVVEIDVDTLERDVPWGRFDGVRAALLGPDDAVVTPSTMAEMYAEAARGSGVEFWLGAPFDPPTRDGEAWTVRVSGRSVRAPRCVLAAGAWSKRLSHALGRPLPLVPYRTQAAVLKPSVPAPLFPSVHDIDRDVYVRPESNGRILAGDGTQLVEVDPERFNTGGDPEFVEHLATTFEERLPGWADAELVRAWAGVCVSTPDRRPLVGAVPGATGLYAMTGFNGFGVMRAGGVARRLAALLSVGDGPSSEREALEFVDPGRFPIPYPEFRPRPGFTLEAGDDPRF